MGRGQVHLQPSPLGGKMQGLRAEGEASVGLEASQIRHNRMGDGGGYEDREEPSVVAGEALEETKLTGAHT